MKTLMSQADAEAIAIEALAWLAQDKDLLPRFLALTGASKRAPSGRPRLSPAFSQGYCNFSCPMNRHCCATARKQDEIRQQ